MRAADLAENGLNCRLLREVVVLLLQNHANGPFPEFQGISLLRLHNSILSKVGVSGKPGGIQ
jgi:hypothetical protein